MGYVTFGRSFVLALLASLLFWPDVARTQKREPNCDSEPGHLTHDFSVTRLQRISDAAEAARAEAESSPFSNACQRPGVFRDRPPTGIFRRAIPLQDSRGNLSADFLRQVAESVLGSMSDEESRLTRIRDCLDGKTNQSSSACSDIQAGIKTILLPLVKKARMHLALAQTVGQIRTAALKRADLQPNSNLSSLGTQKETSWKPLVPNELEKANLILKQDIETAEAEANRLIATGSLKTTDKHRFINDTILSARFTHGLLYVELLSRHPILQYLESAAPADAEIAAAISRMLKNLNDDRAYAEKALKAANETSAYSAPRGIRFKTGPITELPADALGLLDFTSHVEFVLQTSPRFCGLAASLHYTKEDRSFGNGLAIGVPLIAASLALPIMGQWMAGSALGFTTGVGFAVQSKFDRNLAASRFISKLEAESSDEYNDLDRADRDYKIALALGPVAALASPALQVATVGLRASRFGASLAAKTK